MSEAVTMKISKQKCAFCPVWFHAHPRLKSRQKTCGSSKCKHEQNLLAQKTWKKKEHAVCQENQKYWRKAHPDYWKTWRNAHPCYVSRNRMQSRIRKSLLNLSLQRKLDILEVTEKQMEYWNLPRFAKETRLLAPLLWAYNPSHEHVQSP